MSVKLVRRPFLALIGEAVHKFKQSDVTGGEAHFLGLGLTVTDDGSADLPAPDEPDINGLSLARNHQSVHPDEARYSRSECSNCLLCGSSSYRSGPRGQVVYCGPLVSHSEPKQKRAAPDADVKGYANGPDSYWVRGVEVSKSARRNLSFDSHLSITGTCGS
jgi:hypothetical protein